MRKVQSRMRRLLAVVVISSVCSLAQAQPGDPGPDPGGSVPIDGGLSLLIAAGVGYAAKKKYDSRKQSEQQQEQNGNEL